LELIHIITLSVGNSATPTNMSPRSKDVGMPASFANVALSWLTEIMKHMED